MPMTELQPVAERIGQFIRSNVLFGDSTTRISVDTPLLTMLDSLALVQLVAFLEDEFQIAVDDSEVISDNFTTLAAVTSLVEKCAGR